MYRAVVVDDEPFMLEGMRLMIDWAGCGFELCGEASNAQEALRLVETVRPHLLITDVKMPGMMGTDLAAIMHAYHPDVALLFFSGYQEFSFAQSAIRSNAMGYLLKPIDPDEVHTALKNVRAALEARPNAPERNAQMSVLRDHVLRRMASGDDSQEALLRAGVLLGLRQDTPCFCAVLSCARSVPPGSASWLFMTEDAVPFQLTPTTFGLCVRRIQRDVQILVQLRNRVRTGLNLDCRVSAGEVGKGASGFAVSLIQALDAQGVLYELDHGIRVYRDVDASLAEWLMRMKCSALPDKFASDDDRCLKDWIARIRSSILADHLPMFWCRYLSCSVDAILRMYMAETQQSLNDLMPLRALWRDELGSQELWLDEFEARMLLLFSQLHAQRGDGVPTPVADALEIIRTRYAQPLTIGDLAAELHLNAAYLGQLMRKHTGETFHRLLLDVRLNHACRMLRRTAQTVSEIAYEVGFRDVDYFSRQFRARMGMSPNAYRDQEGDSYAPES